MGKLNLSPQEINVLFPIVGVTFYSRGLVLHRVSSVDHPLARVKAKRGKITQVSKRSLNKLVLTVSSCGVKFKSLLTLTYGQNYPVDGRKVKDDLNKFITYMRRSFGAFEYFWFLEFQTRGAPHFHIGLTLEPPGDCERELMAEIWSKIAEEGNWPYTELYSPYDKKMAMFGMNTRDSVFRQHRRKKVWERIRNEDGAFRYCLLYATKPHQKRVPTEYSNVGRFWGGSSRVRLPDAEMVGADERQVRQIIWWLGRNMTKFEVLPRIIFHSGNLPTG